MLVVVIRVTLSVVDTRHVTAAIPFDARAQPAGCLVEALLLAALVLLVADPAGPSLRNPRSLLAVTRPNCRPDDVDERGLVTRAVAAIRAPQSDSRPSPAPPVR